MTSAAQGGQQVGHSDGSGPVLLLVEDDPSIGNLVRSYLGG